MAGEINLILHIAQFVIWGMISGISFNCYTAAKHNNIRSKYWFLASFLMMYTTISKIFALNIHNELVVYTTEIAMLMSLVFIAYIAAIKINRKLELVIYTFLSFVVIIGVTSVLTIEISYIIVYLAIIALTLTNKTFSNDFKLYFLLAMYILLFTNIVFFISEKLYYNVSIKVLISGLNLLSGYFLLTSIRKASEVGYY